jgi:hypothetical protein
MLKKSFRELNGDKVPQKIACITLDLERDPGFTGLMPRLFNDENYFSSFIKILKKYNIPITIFMVMGDQQYLDGCIKKLEELSISFEIAMHSYTHDQKHAASKEEVISSKIIFEKYYKNQKILGYRSPNTLMDLSGIKNLIENNFQYDSSIVPFVRFDEYGYNNLKYPREPFYFSFGGRRLIEFPIATLSIIRLPFIFSYIKLLGISLYKTLIAIFPLPKTVVLYMHPYDFYPHLCGIGDGKGWKKWAHGRNAKKSLELFDKTMFLLQVKGYKFNLMTDVYKNLNLGSNMKGYCI